MTWFEELTGVKEISSEHVHKNIALKGEDLISRANGRVMRCGNLEILKLTELQERVALLGAGTGKLSLGEVVGDVRALHANPENSNALFQVASQFNLLEMIGPSSTPEMGVGIYENDPTQGPACAIAAGAGTIFRNYFVQVNGCIGQSSENQVDCLADLGSELGNKDNKLWEMKNGYPLFSRNGIYEIDNLLKASREIELEKYRGLLKVGIQWGTQVTLNNCDHTVSQVYCSALPVAYNPWQNSMVESFARLILEATYEATMCAAVLNYQRTGNSRVYLTLVGGGAFGNQSGWINDSMVRALNIFRGWDLKVSIVSVLNSNPVIQHLISSFRKK